MYVYLDLRLLKLLSATLLPSPPVTTEITLGDDGSESKTTVSSYVDLNQLQMIGKGAYGSIYRHSAVDLQDICVKVFEGRGITEAHLSIHLPSSSPCIAHPSPANFVRAMCPL